MLGHSRRADASDAVGDCLLESLAEFDASRSDFKTYLIIKVRNRILGGWKDAQRARRKKAPTVKQQNRMYERDRCSEVGFYTASIETLAEAADEGAAKVDKEPLVAATIAALRVELERDYPLAYDAFVLQETSPVRLSAKNLAERLNVTRDAIRAAQKLTKYHYEKILGQLEQGATQ
jgi:DNA-directed RNA polymerase specialized sigma24 family protein